MDVRANLLNIPGIDVNNLTESTNDTMAVNYQKLLGILKDAGCNDQVCTQFKDTLTPQTGNPPRLQFKDRNGSTYDQYMLFLSEHG